MADFASVTADALVPVVFGYSQQAVTRLLDQRAKDYVDRSAARPRRVEGP